MSAFYPHLARSLSMHSNNALLHLPRHLLSIFQLSHPIKLPRTGLPSMLLLLPLDSNSPAPPFQWPTESHSKQPPRTQLRQLLSVSKNLRFERNIRLSKATPGSMAWNHL